jgi:serine/threonine-protein kinase
LTVVDGSRARSSDAERESTGRPDPLIGSVIAGRFRIEKLLASGGMGRVYLATQESIDRPVALKVILHDDDASVPEAKAVERFQLEATILARLQHPNIVTLHDFGAIDGALHGRSYLVMELLEGRSLGQLFDEGQRLAPRRAVAIGAQIARALTYAHQRGVVHRDLKPANIVIVKDESGAELVKLVDFGIGKVDDSSAPKRGLTRTGAVLGTIGYMAPEQLYGIVSPAIDLYALGVVLFESLTGRLPCDDALLGDDLQLDAPPLALLVPELTLPDDFAALVAALLARFADERPTAAEALDRLTQCARAFEATVEPTAPLGAGPRLASLPSDGSRGGASRAGFTSKGTAPELRVITSTVPPPYDGTRKRTQAAMASSPPPLPLLSIAPAAPRPPALAVRPSTSSPPAAPPVRRGSRVVALMTGRVPLAILLALGVALAVAFSRGGLERLAPPAAPSVVPPAVAAPVSTALAPAVAARAEAAPSARAESAPSARAESAPSARAESAPSARAEAAPSARAEAAPSGRAPAPAPPAESSRAPSSPSASPSAEARPAPPAATPGGPSPTPTASATVFSTSKTE